MVARWTGSQELDQLPHFGGSISACSSAVSSEVFQEVGKLPSSPFPALCVDFPTVTV